MGRVTGPFFLLDPLLPLQTLSFSAHPAIVSAVTGLGYDLVDVERAPRGLLRVTIDHPWQGEIGEATASAKTEKFVTVDDCERVTRQLQHVLEVEGLAYERLEVSSPGLDRPIRTEQDFARFSGQEVEIVLKQPFGGRKRWVGVLEPAGEGWRLVLPPKGPAKGKPGAAPIAKKTATPAGDRSLDFTLAEVRDAKLVPVLDFKGRRFHAGAASPQEQESAAR